MQIQAQFNQGRGFGVEIETAWNRWIGIRQITEALTAAGIPAVAPGYTHDTMDTWKVVPDASTGSEIVSPILYGEDGLDQITRVTAVLRAIGLRVDSTTGLHVHHDARHLTVTQMKSVVYLYAKAQAITAALLPTRVGRNWCREVSLRDLAPIGKRIKSKSQISGLTGGRYYSINPTAYATHGTIEFRQHSGSLNASKIRSWVVFTQNFMTAALKKQSTTAAIIDNRKPYIQRLFRQMGSDANCPFTYAARQNIVQRIHHNDPTLPLGSARRYLTRAQRRLLKQAEARRAWEQRDYYAQVHPTPIQDYAQVVTVSGRTVTLAYDDGE
jgi:hypothetical protein